MRTKLNGASLALLIGISTDVIASSKVDWSFPTVQFLYWNLPTIDESLEPYCHYIVHSKQTHITEFVFVHFSTGSKDNTCRIWR